MIVKLEDYVKLYWVTYYAVRGKYFPDDAWRKIYKLKDRSPDMWSVEIPGHTFALGRELFQKNTKWIYLNTTFYNARKLEELHIDNDFLVLVFNEIGCDIPEHERVTLGITDEELPNQQLRIFKEKYPNFLKLYPSVSKAVELRYNEIIKNIEDSLKVNALKISKSEVTGLSDVISNDFYNQHDNLSHKQEKEFFPLLGNLNANYKIVSSYKLKHIREFFSGYFSALNNRDFEGAYGCFAIEAKRQIGTLEYFKSLFIGTQAIVRFELITTAEYQDHIRALVYYVETKEMFFQNEILYSLGGCSIDGPELNLFLKELDAVKEKIAALGYECKNLLLRDFTRIDFCDSLIKKLDLDYEDLIKILPYKKQIDLRRIEVYSLIERNNKIYIFDIGSFEFTPFNPLYKFI